ncbi:hypothetical protein Pmani_020861 [Petrolisthes manimaculis]|uniref:CCHC-type domain-containing protein n=1 Tax=Petrolisthes manimaculis TaxID=1843537 RepID=A0AAE1PHS8_9EUCA|nr:hypothetical protein Pmani_020861 [Petrolisthes manimaculis]
MKTAHSLGMSPEAIEKLVQQEICLQKDKAEREERYADRDQRKLELEQEQLVVGQRRHESDHAEAEKVRIEAKRLVLKLLRCKFRESKCGDNESFTQLVVRMGQYLERWISLSDVAKDYASLFDFLIREQLLSNCNPELRVFLKEREFNNSQDMADAADKWKSAHHYRKSSKPPQVTRPSQPIAKERDKTLNVCHGCGKPGHWRPDCPDNPKNYKGKSSKVSFVFDRELQPENAVTDMGYVFKKMVKVLFDTGCNTVIVKDSLVPSHYKLGGLATVYDFLGVQRTFPKIKCYLSSKFFTGWVDAIAAPIRFADVLIGLIPGVSLRNDVLANTSCVPTVMDSLFENQNDSPQELTLAGDLPSDSLDVSLSRFPPHESKVCVDNNISEVIQDQNVTMAVQTRAGKKKDGKTVELKCPVMDDLEMNRKDFLSAQNTCPTLKDLRCLMDHLRLHGLTVGMGKCHFGYQNTTQVDRVVLTTQAHRNDPFTCNLEETLSPRITLGYEAEKKLLKSSITPDQEKNLRN